MKIELDTNKKTIKLAEDVCFSELIKVLDKMFPKKEWKEFKLITNVEVVWNHPVVIEKKYPYYLLYWNKQTWEYKRDVFCDNSLMTKNNLANADYAVKSGVLQVEC